MRISSILVSLSIFAASSAGLFAEDFVLSPIQGGVKSTPAPGPQMGNYQASPAPPGKHYTLFVHGRSKKNHCSPIKNVSDGWLDYQAYWGGWGYHPTGVANKRFIGFNPEAKGGAYSWSTCGAQRQMYNALRTFCRGSNSCTIITHSTGGLVVAKFLSQYSSTIHNYNITRVKLLANASGGSELADISSKYLGWIAKWGWGNAGGELDHSVSTSGARSFNHNKSGGLSLNLYSGQSPDKETLYITPILLPGKDDGVVANHSLCGVNKAGKVKVSCPAGGNRIKENYACGFLWLKTCTRYHYRWTPYRTQYRQKSATHKTSMGFYNK